MMNGRTTSQNPKLLDRLRTALRMKHYAYRTEKCYVYRARRFIYFHRKKHPHTMGAFEVQSFLSYFAQQERVSASTQNQALNAIVFLYKQVIRKELGSVDAVRVRRQKRLPVVLARSEVELPYALERKYPNAKYGWRWQYVFPAKNVSTGPRQKSRRRFWKCP